MKCCPSGEQVFGICGCCPTCAKAENESCGGLWGFDGTYCRGETDYSFGGFPRDGICTKIEHEGQYHTEYERSDNPEWHKSVPTCDNPTYESSTTTTSHPNYKTDGSKSKITFKGLPI